MSRIAHCLWFDRQAEEAARFYTSLLPDSRIEAVVPYAAETPGGKPGETMTVEFTLAGERYIALNGGPHFRFTPAISVIVECEDQAEIDRLWDALCADGGGPQQCGWLTDRYGLSWQIVPASLGRMLKTGDTAAARRVTEAVLQMVKLDLATLERAYAGSAAA